MGRAPPSIVRWYLFATWFIRAQTQNVDELFAKAEAEKEARLEAKFQQQLSSFAEGSVHGARDRFDELARASVPQTKQISVRNARNFTRELLELLGTEDARGKISAARVEAARMFAEQVDPEENERISEKDAFFTLVGSAIDKIAKGVVLKYEFHGGLEQAFASVSDAMKRKGDPELTAAMELLAEMLAPAGSGQALSLRNIASQFLGMETAQQEDALQKVEKIERSASDDDTKDHAKAYLVAMRGIMSQGRSFVKHSITQAVAAAKRKEQTAQQKLPSGDRKQFDIHVGALMEFLQPTERLQLELQLLSQKENTEL